MTVRPAERRDAARIREISEGSFRTSYSLSPEQIETVLGEAFSEDRLADLVEDPDVLLIVAEEEGTVVGFVDVALGAEAAIRWLHVDPDARGEGVGTRLFEQARSEAGEHDLPLVARVLAENEEGKGFPERFGLARTGKAKLEVGSETLFEEIYTEGRALETLAGEPSVDVPETTTVGGETHYVDDAEETPGTDGPFFDVYADDDREEHVGYFCSNCGSTDVGSDTLGRLECQSCGNKHLADQWDDAYL